MRTSATASNEYERKPDGDDTRFRDDFGSLQSIVISSAQNDSGLFEPNLRDERYLPFEGAGAVSEWRLELPDEFRQFDYDSISDVILHLRYTAREGGAVLRTGAIASVKKLIGDANAVGSVRLFSVRHEFPSEWARFKAVAIGGPVTEAALSISLRKEHYPFWASDVSAMELKQVQFFAKPAQPAEVSMVTISLVTDPVDDSEPGKASLVTLDDAFGHLLGGSLSGGPLPPAVGQWNLHLTDNSIGDLWIAITWPFE